MNNTEHTRNIIDTPKGIKTIEIVYICLIIGAILRVLYCWKYPIQVRDAYTYKFFIDEWARSGKLPYGKDFPPLSVFLLRVPNLLTDCEIMHSGVIANEIMGLCIIIVAIFISKIMISSPLVQLSVGLLFASHPTLIDYSCRMTRENSYLLFTCLSILLFMIHVKKRESVWLILAAAFAAGAFLCRHEALELLFVFCIVILFIKQGKFMQRIKKLGIFATVYVLSLFTILFSIGVHKEYYNEYPAKILRSLNSNFITSKMNLM